MLFKILHGDDSRISTDVTPFHEGYCYVTHGGYLYVDINIGTVEAPNNQRVKLNANQAEKILGYDIATILNFSDVEIPTSKAVLDTLANYQPKTDENLETESKEVVGAINEVNSKTVDKINVIDEYYGDKYIGECTEDGITWNETFALLTHSDEELRTGTLYQRIPLVAGENVTFEVDEENQVVKINATENVVGTWVFNDYLANLTSETLDVKFDFISYTDEGEMMSFCGIRIGADITDYVVDYWVYYYVDNESSVCVCDSSDVVWYHPMSKHIILDKEPPEEIKTLLKGNAIKQKAVGVDKIKSIDTWASGAGEINVDEQGISWQDQFIFKDEEDFTGNTTSSGTISHQIPIVAGENITFEADEDSGVVKINATGGGSASNDSVVGTWVFKDVIELPINQLSFEVSFTCGAWSHKGIDVASDTLYYSEEVGNFDEPVYTTINSWENEYLKTITITEEPTDTEFITWLKANAQKSTLNEADKQVIIQTVLASIPFAEGVEF